MCVPACIERIDRMSPAKKKEGMEREGGVRCKLLLFMALCVSVTGGSGGDAHTYSTRRRQSGLRAATPLATAAQINTPRRSINHDQSRSSVASASWTCFNSNRMHETRIIGIFSYHPNAGTEVPKPNALNRRSHVKLAGRVSVSLSHESLSHEPPVSPAHSRECLLARDRVR